VVTSAQDTSQLKPSQFVSVLQGITTREGSWEARIEGQVLSCSWEPTGSWFADGKDDRLWLQRLRIRKEDGEIADLILDGNSSLTVLQDDIHPA
jgi:hypothetical protein